MIRIPLPSDIVSEILHASLDATIVSDQEGNIRVANQAAEELFGYESGELIGESLEVLIPEEQRARHRDLRDSYQKAPRARPMVSGLEIFGRRKDGSSFRAEVGLNPMETDDGVLVTSTIRPANSADDSEAYFRNLLESAPDAMIIVDEQGKIAIVNAQVER
ncbi:MAG: PAS domain-containing protein, partial [Woeseiaceae bacterium]